MAHLLQLDRPDATPRSPATAEAAPLTPPLSEGSQQDPLRTPVDRGGPIPQSWPAAPRALPRASPSTLATCITMHRRSRAKLPDLPHGVRRADVNALLVQAAQQLDICDVAQPNPAVRGVPARRGDVPPVLVGVTE
jgi:hypothetical protein